jgi:subtilase family serine protease
MLDRKKIIGVTAAAIAVAGMLAGAGGAAASPRPGYATLADSRVPFATQDRVLGVVPGSSRLSIQVWLTPRRAAAEQPAAEVSTPGSRLFHHYLSPGAYTARFGASRAEAVRVESWLRSAGFSQVHSDLQRNYVRATAPVSVIDKAFRVRLLTYRSSAAVNAGRYPLRANDRPVSVPVGLAGSVLGVTGLDNAAPTVPLYQRPGSAAGLGDASSPAVPDYPCSRYYGQHVVKNLPQMLGVTSFPTEVCGYSAAQLRSAYGANMVNTGRGQTIALMELGLTKDMFLILRDYAAVNGVPAPSPSRYTELSLGRGSACGDPFNGEEQLDVEMSYDMAPRARQLVVGGDSCDTGDFGVQGLFNAEIAVLNGAHGCPLASATANGWGFVGGDSQPASLISITHAILLRAASEGVGMYFSSGDSSGLQYPATDPFAVAVGGTSLGIGKTGHRLFETGWSDGVSSLQGHSWVFLGEAFAAGGGPSILWKQPAYQKHVVPPALAQAPGNRGGPVRSSPDISADADIVTGPALGLLDFATTPPSYGQTVDGGTSAAAPLVAGMVIAAQQGQRTSFGFINPVLYRLAGTSAFFDPQPLTKTSPMQYRAAVCHFTNPFLVCGPALYLLDDQNANMLGYTGQVTLEGYDNMTGLGTPNGQKFIAALRKLG